MSYALICSIAFLASGLTFLSGFGLGTLLLPAFALFFSIETAVALTAVVHFLNGVFKLFLVWRNIDWRIVWRFGAPAIVGALAGAWLLLKLADARPLLTYAAFGRAMEIAPAKLMVGVLLLLFSLAELAPSFRKLSFPAPYQPVGGLLSGFFGGLVGMQGALRSAFLVKSGIAKEAYVATGSAVAFLIDISRLSVYARLIRERHAEFDNALLAAAVGSAFLGAFLGNRFLRRMTMGAIKTLVAGFLLLVSLGLIIGLL